MLDDQTSDFEAHRRHLHDVARRMLGTSGEAEDAVQEAWIRYRRADTAPVDNLRGWLTTVVSRVCLDSLRSRTTRRQDPDAAPGVDDADVAARDHDPEHEALVADAIGPALLLVLDTLTPAERIAFVLHDTFAVSFDDIGSILGRAPGAAKQLASRARRKVHGQQPATDADERHQRAVIEAFLAASRRGDFDALLAMLDPHAAVRADDTAVQFGAAREVCGAHAVAEAFAARAHTMLQMRVVDGVAAAVWLDDGTPRALFDVTVEGDRVAAVDIIADPARLQGVEIAGAP